jgi:hypothetical protein
MQTIHLKIDDSVYEKVMWLLEKFSKDEVEIIGDNESFSSVKAYLQAELEDLNSGKAEFLDIDQAETYLENIVRKHENHP